MKVLYVASEALPFITSGGLGDVAGSLPQALCKRFVGCRVVIPLYSAIPDELKEKMKFITSISVPVAWRRQYCGIFECRSHGAVYYFIDNQYYFKRDASYGHYDDAERFAFFSRAVLEMLPHIDFKPDIIHCNDWQTALTSLYFSALYSDKEFYRNIKTVFTIHNIQYQGVYGHELIGDVIGVSPEHIPLLEYDGNVNLMKAGIECANKVTTVSPTYAQEILDPWYSHGLDSILKKREWKLQGILNGIDIERYNPETDEEIFEKYSAAQPGGKLQNKLALQELLGLPKREQTPMIGMISRLVPHKGLDLLKAVADELLSGADIQFVILGSGDWQYENFFTELKARFPEKVSITIGFNPGLAKKIYAGCDLFLMPSKSEPCGLSQMIALRYGTVPIVRETGGLRDSVFDSCDGKGNGFTFVSYNAHDMLNAIKRAVRAYEDKGIFEQIKKRAFASDNSWKRSASAYIKMYKDLLK